MPTSSRRVTLLVPGCFSIKAAKDSRIDESELNASKTQRIGTPDTESKASPAIPTGLSRGKLASERFDALNHADSSVNQHQTYEQALLGYLGHTVSSPGKLPVAECKYSAEYGKPAPQPCVCAEPVHLRADTDNAHLYAAALLAITDEESETILDAVNALLNPDGIALSQSSAGSWYLTGMDASYLDTWPVHSLANGAVAAYMPRHEKAGDWRQLFTEMQMLLHSLPMNTERVSLGKLPINALWFWGGATLADTMGSDSNPSETTGSRVLTNGRVLSNDMFATGLASLISVHQTRLEPRAGAASLLNEYSFDRGAESSQDQTAGSTVDKMGVNNNAACADTIVVLTDLYESWLAGDEAGVCDARLCLQSAWIQPLQQAVHDGLIDEFILDGCNGAAIVETKKMSAESESLISRLTHLFKRKTVKGKTSSVASGNSSNS